MNNKNTLLVSVITVCLCVVPTVIAISPTPEPTKSASMSATPEEKGTQHLLNTLKSQAEGLKKKDQRAYVGIVSKIQDSIVKINAVEGVDEKSYSIKIDDTLTHLYRIAGVKANEIKKGDLKEGDYVIVTGQMLDNTVEANEIYIDEQFLVKTGRISEISKTDYYLKVITYDKDEYTLDIQNSTRQFMLNVKTKEIESIGFSKIKAGDTVHFVVSKKNLGTSKEKNRYDAIRVLVIPQEFSVQ